MTSDGGLRIELFVDDVERSATFYERVLGFAREHESPGYVAIRRGDVRIGIGAANGLPPQHYFDAPSFGGRKGIGVELVIEVDDVESACRAVVEAGHPIVTPLGNRSWGLRDFRIADPDGYYLRITSR
ncbi:MAG: VOC family protein [Chloroflexota bacterium]|nr:VOC family protein [Chloroflexota bacterium]